MYRGIKLKEYEADSYLPKDTINLLGYTSTSKDINNALEFAFVERREDQIPVLFEICFKGNTGLFELKTGYTAYDDEKEVLIQDGLTYRVISNENEFIEQKK